MIGLNNLYWPSPTKKKEANEHTRGNEIEFWLDPKKEEKKHLIIELKCMTVTSGFITYQD